MFFDIFHLQSDSKRINKQQTNKQCISNGNWKLFGFFYLMIRHFETTYCDEKESVESGQNLCQ